MDRPLHMLLSKLICKVDNANVTRSCCTPYITVPYLTVSYRILPHITATYPSSITTPSFLTGTGVELAKIRCPQRVQAQTIILWSRHKTRNEGSDPPALISQPIAQTTVIPLPSHQHERRVMGPDEKDPSKPETGGPEEQNRDTFLGENSPEYPTHLKLIIIIVGLCLAVFLVAIDNTIIATAIPKITDDFKALDDIGWYGSAYLLTTCACQLLFGKFYTFFSIKLVFLLAISIFELGSLICGVAPSSTALIVGRAVAGVGAAGIFSGSLIIIAHNVPLEKRPLYSGFVIGMYGIASVAGPLMGGAFTDHVTWRWCFYINLPIGAVTVILIMLFLKAPPRQDTMLIGFRARLRKFDPIGTVFFIPAVVCLLLALQWGGSKYGWANARIIVLFVLFSILFISFIGVQIWKDENATVPRRILMKRSVAAALWFGFWLGGAFFVFVYYMPVWFQAIKGTSATGSGVRILPLILSQVIAVIVSGGLTTKIGYYTPFMYISTLLMAIGAGLLMKLEVDSKPGAWIGYQIIFGLGVGAGFQQPMMAVQTVLDADDIPVGIATVMFLQLLGGALFVSVGQNVFTNKLISNLASTFPQVKSWSVAQTGATELKKTVALQDIGTLLEGYNGALTRTFMVALILSCLTVFGAAGMEWRSVKASKAKSTDEPSRAEA